MKPARPKILTINGGSSRTKFALFDAGDSPRRILAGAIEEVIHTDEELTIARLVNRILNLEIEDKKRIQEREAAKN